MTADTSSLPAAKRHSMSNPSKVTPTEMEIRPGLTVMGPMYQLSCDICGEVGELWRTKNLAIEEALAHNCRTRLEQELARIQTKLATYEVDA